MFLFKIIGRLFLIRRWFVATDNRLTSINDRRCSTHRGRLVSGVAKIWYEGARTDASRLRRRRTSIW